MKDRELRFVAASKHSRLHPIRTLKSVPSSPIEKELDTKSPFDLRRVLSGGQRTSNIRFASNRSSYHYTAPFQYQQQYYPQHNQLVPPHTAPPAFHSYSTLGVDIAVEALRRRQRIYRTSSTGAPFPAAIPLNSTTFHPLSQRKRFLSASCVDQRLIERPQRALTIAMGHWDTLRAHLKTPKHSTASSLGPPTANTQQCLGFETVVPKGSIASTFSCPAQAVTIATTGLTGTIIATQGGGQSGGLSASPAVTSTPSQQLQHPFPAPKSKFKMAHESFRARMLQEMQDQEAVFMTKKRTADSKSSEFKGGELHSSSPSPPSNFQLPNQQTNKNTIDSGDFNKYTAQSYTIRNGVEIFGEREMFLQKQLLFLVVLLLAFSLVKGVTENKNKSEIKNETTTKVIQTSTGGYDDNEKADYGDLAAELAKLVEEEDELNKKKNALSSENGNKNSTGKPYIQKDKSKKYLEEDKGKYEERNSRNKYENSDETHESESGSSSDEDLDEDNLERLPGPSPHNEGISRRRVEKEKGGEDEEEEEKEQENSNDKEERKKKRNTKYNPKDESEEDISFDGQIPKSVRKLLKQLAAGGKNPLMRKLIQSNIHNEFGVCGWILTILSYILIFLTLPISACMSIKVVQEYERAVIFRLGRLLPGGAKGPGIFFIVPCIDTYRKVDLRVLSFEVPPQEILSKDSVTVAVDAVVYFRISNATISVTNVEDASRSTKLLAQTTLRNILGTKTLAEMLSDREAISLQMQATLDEATEPWGVKVERVEVKDVRLPIQLQRAMAAEAEAAREARAKVIVAEGEQKASRALKEAADVIAESPQAIQLRYLQTLNSISAEKNSTIIFPFPVDLLSALLHQQQHSTQQQPSLSTQNQQQQQTQIQPINRSPVHKTNVFSTVVAPASQQYQMSPGTTYHSTIHSSDNTSSKANLL
uniref:Band 7 domain-containing protein n=1 Tax=Meloidogyne incognita TaxID=6306 RepID=A0A914M3P1_MELIC